MIKAFNIHKTYGKVEVLKGINLTIAEGQIISIVGASGAGKTTLLHILGTLDQADQGNILIDNVDVNALSDKKLSEFRNRKIGFVFQFHHLLPEFTALENVCIPGFIGGFGKKESEEKALALFDFLGLSGRKNHKPSQLSGGEQQRVAVARALINHPTVILADEPSGNLDSAAAKDLHKLFFSLRNEFKQTFVIVTHNEELANMADKKLTIKDGIIVK